MSTAAYVGAAARPHVQRAWVFPADIAHPMNVVDAAAAFANTRVADGAMSKSTRRIRSTFAGCRVYRTFEIVKPLTAVAPEPIRGVVTVFVAVYA